MSGTSLDGVDVVIAKLTGSGPALRIDQRAFLSAAYPPALRQGLLRNSRADTSSVRDLSQLNARLASMYADAVQQALDQVHLTPDDLDLVGSHGQTVHHIPTPEDCAGESVASTLQIGDPSMLANQLGVPVVGGFRAADMALGGQGAPLVPYFDYVYFTDPGETRLLLNLGGIANVTLLPPGADPGDVLAFDTGPANMVIDALANRLFDRPYDPEGSLAAEGTPNNDLLASLLGDTYFTQPPPKSTGREYFGTDYVDGLLDAARSRGLSPHDTLATATMLTATTVYQAYARFVRTEHAADVLIAAGGGLHNGTLMQYLADCFSPIPVLPASDYGLDGDAKEALCFAVLAHETLNGVPTNLPSVTGAARPTLLGTICMPA
jgi:anhydro-N-acetylmuramic acid kinase